MSCRGRETCSPALTWFTCGPGAGSELVLMAVAWAVSVVTLKGRIPRV